MNVPKWLTDLGIPENCVSHQSSSEEHGRRFSIRPRRGDTIWHIQVDGCWLRSIESKKVDSLFWGQSASGRKVVLLVELKGSDFGQALGQINSTLARLCKRADGHGIHIGSHLGSPGHTSLARGGVCAYVVLSKGRGVPLRLKEREQLRKRYGVLVHTGERQIEIDGIDAVFG